MLYHLFQWLEATYRSWGVTVRRDNYGTWRGWNHGTVHALLVRRPHPPAVAATPSIVPKRR